MAHRICISSKIADTRAETKRKQFNALALSDKVKSVAVIDSYTIDAPLKAYDLEGVAQILTNNYLESYSIGEVPVSQHIDWVIEIGFLPGVTDNVGNSAKETIEDFLKIKLKPTESVYYSQIFILEGIRKRSEAEAIASTLYNPLIQRMRLLGSLEFVQEGLPILIPKVTLKSKAEVISVNLDVTDEELTRIGKQGIMGPDGVSRGPLALDLAYMKAIKEYFKKKKRAPTDIELESIAQTWSEHCKHTIFANPIDEISKGLYKSYIKEATNIIRKKKGKKDICVSVFSDNAGAIIFDKDHLITHKVETHNTPSMLDPFGGSITGIVGVNRDTIGFGLGAKPVANMYGFCLAKPDDDRKLFRDKTGKQPLLSARRIMDGVIAGVNSGGNCSGIPTPHGFVYFNDRFRGKPLVFVGTVGVIERKIKGKDSTKKTANKGDFIVVIGGRVGQDGIHGATFSSEGMDEGSPATAVQIGDPITQKKLSDALIKEARDLGLYNSITDNGAGGLSCSVAEMAKECGGCRVDLEKIPLKYPGLEPWQIWISESQERMTLAVPPKKWNEFKKLMERRGVEATVIGEFTNSGKCEVSLGKKKIVDIELKFLHDGLPVKELQTREVRVRENLPSQNNKPDFSATLLALLKRPNLTSFEFISRQYDHEVQAGSVLKPLQGKGQVNSQSAVFKPVLSSNKAAVMSSALFPTYTELDPYNMAASTIDSAIRSAVAAGADPKRLAILDNFCWCDSTNPERLWQLKLAVKACFDIAVQFETPFISGKDSMFNDFKGFDEQGNPVVISALPTLLVSTLGVMDDATKAVSIDFKFKGDLVYVLGETQDELGGSEYYEFLGDKDKAAYTGKVPVVDVKKNKKLYEQFAKAVSKELISSAQSIEKGGLAVALAKSSVAGLLGAQVTLPVVNEVTLFSESQGRILVSINPKNKKAFEAHFKGLTYSEIGKVAGSDRIEIRGKDKGIIDMGVTDALNAYKSTFKDF